MNTEESVDNLSTGKRKRRLRTRSALLGVALLMGLLGFLWVCRMQERREFVSKADPATGYRCRFTLSTGWRHLKDQDDLVEGFARGMYGARFSSNPSSPLLKWITDHLTHRPSSQGDQGEPAAITLFVQSIHSPTEVSLQDGYPAFPNGVSALSERHLVIDGCRATLETFPYSGTPSAQETDLLVCTPDHKVVFQVIAYSAMQGDATDREMQQILHSFHVEKVGN